MDKKKILIIDDDKNYAQLIKLKLEETGKYEVSVENDAKNSFSAAKETDPDLILLDVIMPGMDGADVAQKMKVDDALKDIPIIFLTAIVADNEVTSRGDNIGGYPFIAKSAKIEKLIEIVGQHIYNKYM